MDIEKENAVDSTGDVSGENTAAAPKRKPVIRKVSAAPTKFAPKRQTEDGAVPPAPAVPLVPFDDDFTEEDDAAAYAAAAEEDRRNA